MRIVSARLFFNVLVFGVLAGFFYGLYIMFREAPKILTDRKCPSSGNLCIFVVCKTLTTGFASFGKSNLIRSAMLRNFGISN